MTQRTLIRVVFLMACFLMPLAIVGCAVWQAPDGNTSFRQTVTLEEFMLTITTRPPQRLSVAPLDNHLPVEVIADINQLADLLRELAPRQRRIRVSPSGRSVVVYDNKNPVSGQERFGIVIWPSWESPDEYTRLRRFRDARFIGACHIFVTDETLDSGTTPTNRAVVDVRDPTQLYFLSPRLQFVRVAPSGVWIGVTSDGRVFTGTLSSSDSFDDSSELPMEAPCTNAILLHDGTVAVVELQRKTLWTVDVASGHSLEIREGALGGSAYWWIDTIISFQRKKPSEFLKVSRDGQMQIIGSLRNVERPFKPSPSGRYFRTHQDRFIPGAVKGRLRVRPDYSSTTATPKVPRGQALVDWISR